jgi:hypothetical protein
MTGLHCALVIIALIVEAIGIYGYRKHIWSFSKFMYLFTIPSVWGFWLGIFPSLEITISLMQSVFVIIYIASGSLLITYLIVKYVEKNGKK